MYTPVAQRGGEEPATPGYKPVTPGPTASYTPVAARAGAPKGPVGPALVPPPSFSMGGVTTPAADLNAPPFDPMGIPKTLAQIGGSIAVRSPLSIALSLAPEKLRKDIGDIKAEDFNFTVGGIPVKLGTALLGDEPVKSFQEQLPGAKSSVESLGLGKASLPIAFIGTVGGPLLDLLPQGELAKQGAVDLSKAVTREVVEQIVQKQFPKLFEVASRNEEFKNIFLDALVKAKTPGETTKILADTNDALKATLAKNAEKAGAYKTVEERTAKGSFSEETGGYSEIPKTPVTKRDSPEIQTLARQVAATKDPQEAATLIKQAFPELSATQARIAAEAHMATADVKAIAEDIYKRLLYIRGTTVDTRAPAGFTHTIEELTRTNVTKALEQKAPRVGDIIADAKGNRVRIESIAEGTKKGTIDVSVKGYGPKALTRTIQDIKGEVQAVRRAPSAEEHSLMRAAETNRLPTVSELPPLPKIQPSAEVRAALDAEGLAKSKEEIEQAKLGRSFVKDAAHEAPARELSKFESRQTGQLPEVTGKRTKESLTGSGKIVKGGKFTKEGDQIVQALGFESVEDAQKALDDYKEMRQQVRDMDAAIRDKVKNYRDRKAVFEEVKRYVNQETRARRDKIAAVQDFFKFTDGEMKDLLKGQRDIRLMSDQEFENFMKRLEGQATEMHFRTRALMELQATIFEKELQKVDNIRRVMKLPKLENMSVSQLQDFNRFLEPFKQGDEFLTIRKLQTVEHTDLKGIHTLREARERLLLQVNKERLAAGKAPVTLEELNHIKVHELDRYRGDTTLARQNPLYDLMVHEKNKAFLTAEAEVFKAEEHINELFKAARASRSRGFLDRLIPTDNLIFRWMESSDAEKLILAKDMTHEELEAGMYLRDSYAEMRDYLVQQKVLKKYISDYITHVRRGFLEAWKEEGTYVRGVVSGERPNAVKRAGSGFLAAFKEIFKKYMQDEAYFNIIDQATDQILPLEKFFQFSMKRTGELVPSKNVAKAYLQYLTTFEKKRALDSIVPKLDIYVHSLTPKKLTPRGLEFDSSLKKFFKEWMNTKKGRATSQALIKPGGQVDWTLRTAVALTRLIDLGLSIPVGIASNFGAQIAAYRGLGEAGYARGVARLASGQGRSIVKKYKNFAGEPVLTKMFAAKGTLGDSLSSGVFGLFSFADRKARQVYLLGSMTAEEYKAGELGIDRLARMRTELGRHLPVEGSDSIIGKTALGKAGTQYKSWALPLLSSTASDLHKMGLAIRTRDASYLKSPEFGELLRTAVLSSVVGLFAYSISVESQKNLTFTEKLASKAAQDALSLIGALDPQLWSKFRLLGFVENLALAVDQIVTVQHNATGGLKGLTTLKNTLIPGVVKQLLPPAKKKSASGLPALPQLPGGAELPPLPKLPKLPTLPKF